MADESLGRLKIGIKLDGTEMKDGIMEVKRNLKTAQMEFQASIAGVTKYNRTLGDLKTQSEKLHSVLKTQVAISEELQKQYQELKTKQGASTDEIRKAEQAWLKSVSAMKKTESQLLQTNDSISKFGKNASLSAKEIDVLNKKTENTERTMKNMSKTSVNMGTSFQGIGTSFLKLGGLIGAAATALQGLNVIGNGISYNAKMEQLNTSFATMLGSTQKAQELTKQLQKMASVTPFETSDLAQASQTMLAFGFNTQDTLKYMKVLGDISQGNREKFNSLTLSFSQMSSTGHLMGQDLLQMIGQGFNPLLVISQKTGKSMDTLKTEMSKGAISAKEVQDAFVSATEKGGQFYQAMEKQSQTFNGQLSTLKDNMNTTIGKMTKPMFDGLTQLMGYANSLMDVYSKKGMNGILDAVFPKEIASRIKDIATNIGTFKDGISALFGYFEGDPKGMKAFNNFFGTDALTVSTNLDDLKKSFSDLGTSVQNLFSQVDEAFSKGKGDKKDKKDGKQEIINFLTDLTKALVVATQAANGFVKAMTPVFTNIASFTGQSSKQISDWWAQNGTELDSGLGKIYKKSKEFNDFLNGFLMPMFSFLGSTIEGVISYVINYVLNLFKLMVDGLTGNSKGAQKDIQNIWGGIKDFFVGLFKNLWKDSEQSILNFVNNVKKYFNIDLFQIGVDMINGLAKGIDSTIKTVEKKLKGLAQDIPDWLKSALGIHSPSKVLALEVGQHIPTGIVMGIQSSMPKLRQAVTQMGLATIPNVSIPSGAKTFGSVSNQTNTFAPNVTINTTNPFESAIQNDRLMRRLAFQGGLNR